MNKKVEHKAKSILSIILLISILGGCDITSEYTNNKTYTDMNIANQTNLVKKYNTQYDSNFETNYFELFIPEKSEIGDITVFDNKIYYIVLFVDNMSNIAEKSRVYEYDTITNETTLIHEIQDSEVSWVNELRANNSKLFWTTLGENKFTLESFDLKTKEVRKIHSVNNNETFQPIVLGGNNEYFTWYEYDSIDNEPSLAYYNLAEDEISYIKEDNLFFDTYDRANLNQEGILVLQEIDDVISFNLVNFDNLEMEKMFDLSKMLGCVFSRVSDDYIIWKNDYRENKIYIYNIKLQDMYMINLDKLQINTFSIHLYKDIIYINTGNDILYLDLDENLYGFLSKNNFHKESLVDWNYTSSKLSLDGQYISLLNGYSKDSSHYYASVVKYIE